MDPWVIVGVAAGVCIGAYAQGFFEGWRASRRRDVFYVNCTCGDVHLPSCALSEI